jgi:hypothetical protein
VLDGEENMPEPRDEKVSAFEATYLRYAPRMYRAAIRNFGVRPADAAEIVQAIFILYFTQAEEVENIEMYLLAGVCEASRAHLAPPGARYRRPAARPPAWRDASLRPGPG